MTSLVARYMVERFIVDRSPQRALIAVPLTFLILATVAVALRIYARRLKRLPLGTDDFLCIAALVFAYANQASIFVLVLAGGAGLPPMEAVSGLEIYFKALVADYMIWQVAVCCIQCSILFFYMRLFGTSQLFKTACFAVIGLCIAWWIGSFVVIFAACNPVYKAWEPFVPGICIDTNMSCTGLGIVHVIFDFFILSLPLPIIWKLQMKTSNKVLVSILLLVAIFGTICSILRMECIITLIDGNPMEIDTQWLALLFQDIEVPVALICTCVPIVPPVWQHIAESRFGTSIRSLLGGSSAYSDGSKQQWAGVGESAGQQDRFEGISTINIVTDADIEFAISLRPEVPGPKA